MNDANCGKVTRLDPIPMERPWECDHDGPPTLASVCVCGSSETVPAGSWWAEVDAWPRLLPLDQ